MWKIFKNHPEATLIVAAIILLAVLAASFFWGITVVATNVDRSVGTGTGEKARSGFDFKGAQGLDLKGLVK